MSDRIVFSVSDPLATPAFLIYASKAGVTRTQPTFVNLGGGSFGFTPTDADVAVGAAYLIDTGSTPQYECGSVHSESSPFATVLLVDEVTGTLWAGADPSVGMYQDFALSQRASQPLVVLASPYLFALVPTAADVAAGTAWRVDSPPGAAPPAYVGGFALVVGAPGTSLAEDMVAALVGDATVTSLLSGRIYPNLRPPAAPLPLAVYNVVSQVSENALAETAQTRLKHTRMQIDCYAKTYLAAHAVAVAIENVLANLSSPDLAGWKDMERDLYDNEAQLHRVSCDYILSSG